MDNSVAVKKINSAQDLIHEILYPGGSEARGRTSLEVSVEISVDMFEYEVEDHLSVIAGPMADIEKFDNVGVVVLAEVAEERDLSEDRHGDSILGEGDADFLHGDNGVRFEILCLVDSPVGACSDGV